MSRLILFTLAALILGVSFALIRNTSALSDRGGDAYERMRSRALVAKVLFVAGLLCLSVAILAAFVQR
jgi:hypothetical protein